MQCCLGKQLTFSFDKLNIKIASGRTVTNFVNILYFGKCLLMQAYHMPDRAECPEQLKLDRESLTTYLISKGRLCVDQLCANLLLLLWACGGVRRGFAAAPKQACPILLG